MNRDLFNSAIRKMQSSMGNNFKLRKLIPIFIILIAGIAISLMLKQPIVNNSSETETSQAFKILENTLDTQGCYISVVYLDGYAYSPSEWLSYSRTQDISSQGILKGNKIGEVTLDLKGKKYTGTPPDFSSTFDLGAEIYEVKNQKKERAVILKDGDYEAVFYRERKAVSSEKEPINLVVSDIFNMLTNTPKVAAIELRSEEDGSWMRTIKDQYLNSIINKELPALSLRNHGELEIDPYKYNDRIPINLIFEDGAAIHMQVLPESKFAAIFGGYIPLSEKFVSTLQELSNDGEEYSRMTQLIPYKQEEVAYLSINNYFEQKQIVCKEPKWSSGALYDLLGYYRVMIVDEDLVGKLAWSVSIGKSEANSIYIEFYENENKEIFMKMKDNFYKIVKGQLRYTQLKDFISNYTS